MNIKKDKKIAIISGDNWSCNGFAVLYTGKVTEKDIKKRLKEERYSDDRWARAV